MSRDRFQQTAESTPYDNSDCDLVAEDVKSGLDELCNVVNTSASPGFSFGKASNVNNGSWLQCETVPSNKAGRYVYINNAVVTRVFISSETISTYDIEVYSHEGDSVNLTLLGTVSIVAVRGDEFSVSWSVTTGTQLALKLVNGSGKNLVAGLELQGTN